MGLINVDEFKAALFDRLAEYNETPNMSDYDFNMKKNTYFEVALIADSMVIDDESEQS